MGGAGEVCLTDRWEPVALINHSIKFRLAYVVAGERIVGFDNERGRGCQ